jgi:hypothetical protein
LNKNHAINAVVGGVKYIKLVTLVAAPWRIITNNKELAPIDKANMAHNKKISILEPKQFLWFQTSS